MDLEATLGRDVYTEETVTGLLVRYWGLGRSLSSDEKELLLLALDEENKSLQGPIHLRAIERLKEKGIY